MTVGILLILYMVFIKYIVIYYNLNILIGDVIKDNYSKVIIPINSWEKLNTVFFLGSLI